MKFILGDLYNAIKSKYNRIIEAQIIANLNIEAGAARTKYGAELFYVGEIKSQTIRRGFYNVLHRLFASGNDSVSIEMGKVDTLNAKVRYTLLKVATALHNQGSYTHAELLLNRLDASSAERNAIELLAPTVPVTMAKRNVGKANTPNKYSDDFMARVTSCVDVWIKEALLRSEVRPAGISDLTHIPSHRERRVKFTEGFDLQVRSAGAVFKNESITNDSTVVELSQTNKMPDKKPPVTKGGKNNKSLTLKSRLVPEIN